MSIEPEVVLGYLFHPYILIVAAWVGLLMGVHQVAIKGGPEWIDDILTLAVSPILGVLGYACLYVLLACVLLFSWVLIPHAISVAIRRRIHARKPG